MNKLRIRARIDGIYINSIEMRYSIFPSFNTCLKTEASIFDTEDRAKDFERKIAESKKLYINGGKYFQCDPGLFLVEEFNSEIDDVMNS